MERAEDKYSQLLSNTQADRFAVIALFPGLRHTIPSEEAPDWQKLENIRLGPKWRLM